MDLHSVNYLHAGASKQWYVVPPAHRPRFERLMRSLLQDLFRACPEFMRHKVGWGRLRSRETPRLSFCRSALPCPALPCRPLARGSRQQAATVPAS